MPEMWAAFRVASEGSKTRFSTRVDWMAFDGAVMGKSPLGMGGNLTTGMCAKALTSHLHGSASARTRRRKLPKIAGFASSGTSNRHVRKAFPKIAASPAHRPIRCQQPDPASDPDVDRDQCRAAGPGDIGIGHGAGGRPPENRRPGAAVGVCGGTGTAALCHTERILPDPWSVFDLIVVGIALVPASGPFAVLRALRVLRVLRVLTIVPSMRRVVGACSRPSRACRFCTKPA
jgi:hypothetical protein